MGRGAERAEAKKLIEAAEHWARGGKATTDDAEADLEVWGGAPEEFKEAVRSGVAEDFEVDPENWDVVTTWTRIATQWRYSAGGPAGLDYGAVLATMGHLRIADADGSVFTGLQVMEGAALKVMLNG